MRTFVAIEVTDSTVLNSIKKIQNELKIKVKPVEIHNIHFTLLFLGEISEDVVEQVKENLSKIDFSTFDVKFMGVGAFPKPRFPRVIWVGTDVESGQKLSILAKKVEDSLQPLGFKSDKPFRPHLTIFRIKNKIGDITNIMKPFYSIQLGSQQISELKFKKSELTPNGPNYSDLLVVKSK